MDIPLTSQEETLKKKYTRMYVKDGEKIVMLQIADLGFLLGGSCPHDAAIDYARSLLAKALATLLTLEGDAGTKAGD